MKNSTKFILEIYKVDESHLGSEIRSDPETDECDIYLSALVDDLRSIGVVSSLTVNGHLIMIETNEPVSTTELMALFKHCFSNDMFDKYRHASLSEVE